MIARCRCQAFRRAGVLQQDRGAALSFDVSARWPAWAPDLEHATVACGHVMAEESPGEVVDAVRALPER